MSDPHLLNLTALAGEQVDDYALLSFRGREAISEPFDYTIEVITDKQPVLTDWTLPSQEIHAVYPSPRLVPAKVSGFIEWLQGQLGDAWWADPA